MENIDFSKSGGIVPVVVQDHQTLDVLMLAYMNQEAWEATQRTGKAHYYSRSRDKQWLKGEESGHIQEVKELLLDCDSDTLILKVIQHGSGACHMGYKTCFYRHHTTSGWEVCLDKAFEPEEVYKK